MTYQEEVHKAQLQDRLSDVNRELLTIEKDSDEAINLSAEAEDLRLKLSLLDEIDS